MFHIRAIGRGYPAKVVSIGLERLVGDITHRCQPGEDEYKRNVNRIVEMAMIVVVSAFVGEDNREYFK